MQLTGIESPTGMGGRLGQTRKAHAVVAVALMGVAFLTVVPLSVAARHPDGAVAAKTKKKTSKTTVFAGQEFGRAIDGSVTDKRFWCTSFPRPVLLFEE